MGADGGGFDVGAAGPMGGQGMGGGGMGGAGAMMAGGMGGNMMGGNMMGGNMMGMVSCVLRRVGGRGAVGEQSTP